METVKVDMQKLQLLNERIAQTIDALNQLRLSVHGIQHTPYGSPYQALSYGTPWSPFAQPQFVPAGFVPQQFAAQQFAQPFYGPSFGGNSYGIQHTSPMTTTTPWTPITQPSWVTPYATNGLSHTTWTY
jgi:hypothetical protein